MVKKNKKEEDKLNPIMEDSKGTMTKKDLNEVFQKLDKDSITFESGNESAQSFFRAMVKEMNSKDNISLKTEYLNVQENYAGVKLEYLSTYGNMPFLKKFVEIFEEKRVSLGRKGRKENVMMLQERRQEIVNDRMQNFNATMGLN